MSETVFMIHLTIAGKCLLIDVGGPAFALSSAVHGVPVVEYSRDAGSSLMFLMSVKRFRHR